MWIETFRWTVHWQGFFNYRRKAVKSMTGYKAMLFDLDETLLNREKAIDELFLMILDRFYEGVDHSAKKEMLKSFKEYDLESYGDYSPISNHRLSDLKTTE